jgi:hypothetical protein
MCCFHLNVLSQNINNLDKTKEFTVGIKKKSVFLTNAGKAILDSVVWYFQKNSNYKIRVVSNGSASEEELQLAWDKTVSVIKYLLEKKIDSSHFIFQYGWEGDLNTVAVSLVSSNQEGNNWVPAPIPCYSYHRLTKKRCKDPHK